jgi:hypothetical protein
MMFSKKLTTALLTAVLATGAVTTGQILNPAVNVQITLTLGTEELLSVPGLCVVERKDNYLVIRSKGPVVEWSLLAGATYTQGEVPPGQLTQVPLPHYKTFILTVARPVLGKIGVIIGRENDGRLGYKAYVGGPFTTLQVPGLGFTEVVVQGGNLYLHIHCDNPGVRPVEYSILSGADYYQSEAGGWAKPEFAPADKYEPLPHYRTFIFVMARYGRIGGMIARENDGQVVAVVFPLGATFTRMAVPDLGSVVRDGDRLRIECFNPGRKPVEYSILSGNTYHQSEAGGWAKPEFEPAVKYEPLPHYKTFIVVIARYDEMGIMIGRENDGQVGAIILP